MAKGGMCGDRGMWHAWQIGGMRGKGGACVGYNEIQSMSGRYASHWNAFLFMKTPFTNFRNKLYWVVIALGGYHPYLVKKTIKHAVFIHGPFTLRTSVNACINNDAPVNTTSNAPQNLDVTPN